MGALHFLDHDFNLTDDKSPTETHTLELYETGGGRYLRIWIGGRGTGNEVRCKVTKEQAVQLADAAEYLRDRIAD